jgi:hypothetical protein
MRTWEQRQLYVCYYAAMGHLLGMLLRRNKTKDLVHPLRVPVSLNHFANSHWHQPHTKHCAVFSNEYTMALALEGNRTWLKR